jgi:hypothetical protein
MLIIRPQEDREPQRKRRRNTYSEGGSSSDENGLSECAYCHLNSNTDMLFPFSFEPSTVIDLTEVDDQRSGADDQIRFVCTYCLL